MCLACAGIEDRDDVLFAGLLEELSLVVSRIGNAVAILLLAKDGLNRELLILFFVDIFLKLLLGRLLDLLRCESFEDLILRSLLFRGRPRSMTALVVGVLILIVHRQAICTLYSIMIFFVRGAADELVLVLFFDQVVAPSHSDCVARLAGQM